MVKGQARGVRWWAFAAVCGGYLAVTVGESVLAPLYPLAAEELGVDVAQAGLALGLMTGSIAIGNVAGGAAMGRWGVRTPLLVACSLVSIGGLVAATAGGLTQFLVSQVALGLAAGVFFAPGISSAGALGGTARRGLTMGIFGVAFSLGLALAALLTAAGSRLGWQSAFLAVAALGLAAGVALGATTLPSNRAATTPLTGSMWRALGPATAVGCAAAVGQYGTVNFFPLFAVEEWEMGAGAAALTLAVARVVSAPVKTGAGHLADRYGARRTSQGLGLVLLVSGALWIVAPTPAWGAVPAVLFAATVSGVFPLANLLSLDALGDRGALLGTYRSAQMATGAVAAAAIGAGAATIGLRATLAVTLLAPATLVALGFVEARAPSTSPAA